MFVVDEILRPAVAGLRMTLLRHFIIVSRNAKIRPITEKMPEIIQNLIVIFVSGQPMASK